MRFLSNVRKESPGKGKQGQGISIFWDYGYTSFDKNDSSTSWYWEISYEEREKKGPAREVIRRELNRGQGFVIRDLLSGKGSNNERRHG